MAEPDDPTTPDRGPRMRKSASERAKADFFYQPVSVKRGGAYVSVPPGRNTKSALPWRVGVRLFEADTKTGGETFLKLHVEDGPVEKTSTSTKGRWRPWEAHTSLWVGDPATDHLVVKPRGYQAGSGAVPAQSARRSRSRSRRSRGRAAAARACPRPRTTPSPARAVGACACSWCACRRRRRTTRRSWRCWWARGTSATSRRRPTCAPGWTWARWTGRRCRRRPSARPGRGGARGRPRRGRGRDAEGGREDVRTKK